MARPGDTVRKQIRVIDTTGAGVTGLTISAFTVTAGYWANGAGSPAVFSPSASLTEIAGGRYWIQYTLPNIVGNFYIQILPVSASHFCSAERFQDELENNDFDSIGSLVARPLVTISGQGTLGQITPLNIVNKKHVVLSFAFNDVNGSPINMTAGVTYTNFKFGVRSQTDQTLTPPKLDATNGSPTGFAIVGSNGMVQVTIPMNASFFTLAEGASPALSVTHQYDLTAELVAAAGERVSLVQSSPLTIWRREEGT
jgi:hypothetical protein